MGALMDGMQPVDRGTEVEVRLRTIPQEEVVAGMGRHLALSPGKIQEIQEYALFVTQ